MLDPVQVIFNCVQRKRNVVLSTFLIQLSVHVVIVIAFSSREGIARIIAPMHCCVFKWADTIIIVLYCILSKAGSSVRV